ncbi:MAG: methyl-accepting chemotaxis protein [Treponema sp.]|jgi:methyl-accepting chemotaxis protein|nr:methyl-accepting chemotaxis protein [Treponema sp.]
MKFFKDLPIGAKFLCASLLIAGIFTMICWWSISTIENCHMACGTLMNGAVTTKSLVQSAQTSFYALTETANQSLCYTNLEDSAKGRELKRTFDADAKELLVLLDQVSQALQEDPMVDPSLIARLISQVNQAKAALDTEYVPFIDRLIDTQGYEENQGQVSADFTRSVVLSKQIAGDLDAVFQDIAKAGDDLYHGYVTFLLGTILKLKLFDIIALMFSVLLTVFIALAIRKPFSQMMNTLKEIAGDWDLTKPLTFDRQDEIGRLAAFLNLTFEKMRSLLLVIKNMTTTLSGNSAKLHSNIYQTASSINEINAVIHSINGQMNVQVKEVDQTHKAMARILALVNRLDEHIASQAESVSQSSASIEQMLANIHAVAETLSKNEGNVLTLGQASEAGMYGLEAVVADIQEIARESEGLLEINSVIENIASQTNLLSMNAAIEAAHAGEAGKGFAVVADEIRKLAEDASEQSKTIGSVLQKIKGSIDVITQSTGVMVEEFKKIRGGVETVSNQEALVRDAMEEQEVGSRSILEQISKLKTITSMVKHSSSEIATEGQEVKHQSDVLEQITSEINSGMDEMTQGAELIGTAANHVSDISNATNQSVITLSQEIAKFKV